MFARPSNNPSICGDIVTMTSEGYVAAPGQVQG